LVLAAAGSSVLEALGDKKYKKREVDPSILESLYKKNVTPMTKDIEVAYLFRRCGRERTSSRLFC
jgi:hypothetical protein